MLNKRILIMAALLLSLVAGTTWAAAPQRALEIMNQVKVVDGFINEKLHAEFWAEIKKSVRPDPDGSKLKTIEKQIRDATLANMAFPLEGWRSAKLSLEQKKVVRTPELVRQTAILNRMDIGVYAKAIASTNQLLEAAATGKPLSRDGRTVYINQEMIDQVLDGMDASTSRLAMLTNPAWTTEMHEQFIPSVGLTVLTQDNFAVSSIKDLPMKGRVASRNTGTAQEQMVQVKFEASQQYDLNKAARAACDGALGSIGIECKPMPTKWRGLDGLSAVAPVTLDGKAYGMAIITVQRQKERAILTVMSIMEGSPADASLALDELLNRIKLN